MRFSCDSCQARYTIADEKVRGKILRVRCKRCGNAILLKEQDGEVEDDLTPAASDDESTRVVRTDDVQRAIDRTAAAQAQAAPQSGKFVSRAGQAPAPRAAAEKAPGAAERPEKKEWFVIVGGKEVGPMTRPDLAARVQSGEVTPRTYVWRDGMAQWGRLRDVAELKDVADAVPSARPGAPETGDRTVREVSADAARVRAAAEAALQAELEALSAEDADRKAEEDARAAEEAERLVREEAARAAEQAAHAAEARRKAEDERRAAVEALRRADEEHATARAQQAELDALAAEELRRAQADERAAAEARQLAEDAAREQAAADARRRDDEENASEAKKKADDEKKASEAKKKADDERKASEAKKKADDERKASEAKKQADEPARALSGRKPATAAPSLLDDDDEKTDAGHTLSSLYGDDPTASAEQLLSLADQLDIEPAPKAGRADDVAAAFPMPDASSPGKAREPAAAPPVGPLVGGAAAPSSDDPFASVPDSPHFHEAAPGETTNAIIRASGAKEKNYGRAAASLLLIVVGLGGATYAGLRFGGVITVDAPARPREERSDIDWTKVKQVDNGTNDILTGENKRKEAQAKADAEAKARADEEAAARLAEARKRDADLGQLIPKDDDREGATAKAAKKDVPTMELTPEQLMLINSSKGDHPKSAGPASPKVNLGVDDGFDLNRKSAAGSGGGPDEKVVGKKIAEAQSGFENCISNALRRNPDLKLGRVKITATIGSSGIVTKAVFDQPRVGDSDVGQCLRKVVKGIVFPAFEGDPTDVEIPLTIGSAG